MKDWAVITGAAGDHNKFLKVTMPTLYRYGEVFDMDVARYELDATDPPLRSSWQKIMLLRNKLDAGYQGVLWVDADAMFVRFDEDIRDLAQPGWNWVHNRYVGKPWLCVPCTGVVAVTPEAIGTLDVLWQMRDEHLDAPWVEQSAAHELFAWQNFSGALADPDGQHELPARWNSTPESPADNPVIFHAASYDYCTFDSRLDLLIQRAADLL